MTGRFLMVGLVGLALAGCAGTSTVSSDQSASGPAGITTASTPGDSDNPPPKLSGYVDSSYTVQTK